MDVVRLPDGRLTVRIRGAGGAASEPLFVIDGSPVHPLRPSGALDGINPAVVVRIEVLKDAAAAAIYGSRGGNGVVLITTRHPR